MLTAGFLLLLYVTYVLVAGAAAHELPLIAAITAALFLWGFPWLEETFGINQVTVG